MSKAAKVIWKVNAERAKRGLGPTSAGFDYAEAIQRIMKKLNCTQASIGARIGLDARQVGNLLNGTLPNHISGELLYGLWADVFKCAPPMSAEQKNGHLPDVPKKRTRLVE